MKLTASILLCSLVWLGDARAELVPDDEDLYVRVVDVGAGLCTITRAPGPHFMVYDAGHWNNHRCRDAALEIIGDHDIDLMVISHNDSDHLGDADLILDHFFVKKIIRTGFKRVGTGSWEDMNKAIGKETLAGATVINLGTEPLLPGTKLSFGAADIQLVRGYSNWPYDKGRLSAAELRNVISIVLRLTYQGSSILFAGDTVGRDLHVEDDDQCKYAEQLMVDKSAEVPIDADVIIAPHHGSQTSGSTCFLNAVGAEFAIFSAGHAFRHPTERGVERYLGAGVSTSAIFRTDRGDDEGNGESPLQRVPSCRDRSGDDDVEVVIRQNGQVEVEYMTASADCGS